MSEPDLRLKNEADSDQPLSREDSFFSLTSTSTAANSVYYSARESLSDDLNEAKGSKNVLERPKTLSSSIPTSGESSTLGSMTSFNGIEGANEDVNGSSARSSPENDSATSSTYNNNEVKADLTRICSEIAEVIPEDSTKRASILLAIKSENVEELKKLAVSEGGFLSSKFILFINCCYKPNGLNKIFQ